MPNAAASSCSASVSTLAKTASGCFPDTRSKTGPKARQGRAKPDAGNWADWAAAWFSHRDDDPLVNGMSAEDTAVLRENLKKLDRRIDVARTIALGTNVPDSVTAAVNRESPNMVQGVIVFATVVIIVLNLLVDLLYAWIDPRIRLA